MTREKLRDTRLRGAARRREILGVRHCVFIGYEEAISIRRSRCAGTSRARSASLRPDVIFTIDPTFRVADNFYVKPSRSHRAGEVALRAINPMRRRAHVPGAVADEHLEPHKPKALFLQAFARRARSSTSATCLRSRSGAAAHKSQLWPGAAAMIRGLGEGDGQGRGLQGRRVLPHRPPRSRPRPAQGREGACANARRARAAASCRQARCPKALGHVDARRRSARPPAASARADAEGSRERAVRVNDAIAGHARVIALRHHVPHSPRAPAGLRQRDRP